MASVDDLCRDLEDKMDMLRARQSRRDQFLAKNDSGSESPQGQDANLSSSQVGETVVTSTVPPPLMDIDTPSSPSKGRGGGDNDETNHSGQDIHLGNLPGGTTEEELMSHFQSYRPLRARVLNNQGDNWSYGFVRLPSMDQAKAAMQAFNGMETNGHKITIRLCRDRSKARIIEEGVTRGLSVPDPEYVAMTVHVGNLSLGTTEEEVMKLFEQFGGIARITLAFTFDRKRMYSRVTLRSAALVEKAVTELRGATLHDLPISINKFGVNRTPQHYNKAGGRQLAPRHTGHQNRGSMANLANARRLIQKIEVLSSEVLDSCEFCHRLQCLIKELQGVLHEM